MFCLLKPIALIFLTLLKLPNETNRTDISLLFMTWHVYYYLINKVQCLESLKQYIYLTWTLHAVFIIYAVHAFLKMWLKVERSSLQFVNLNLLRSKRKENWTLWGYPFSIHIWLVYVIVRWPAGTKDLVRKTYFGIIINNFGFKTTLRANFFGKSKEHFLYAVCFPNALNRICLNSKYIQVIYGPIKNKNNRAKFTYVRVNFIFQPSL